MGWSSVYAAPLTKYFYSIRGSADSDTSVQSNCDSIITGEIVKVNRSAIVKCDWYPDSLFIGLSFLDGCNYEDGYIINVAKDTNDYIEYNFLKSENPGKIGDTSLTKIRNVEHNTWYRVTLGLANKGVDTSWFQPCTLFTLKAQELLDSEPVVYLSSLLSEFPLESNLWSMKIGDDFISGEENGISIVNISNLGSPQFKKMLAPPAFNKNIAPIKDDLLTAPYSKPDLNGQSQGYLGLFKFNPDSVTAFKMIDSLVYGDGGYNDKDYISYVFNDSMCILTRNYFQNKYDTRSYSLFKINSDSIVKTSLGFFGRYYDIGGGIRIPDRFLFAYVTKEFLFNGVLFINNSGSYILDYTKQSSGYIYQTEIEKEVNLLSASQDIFPQNRVEGIRVSGDLTGVKKLFINQKDSVVYLVRPDKLSIYRYTNQPNIKIQNRNFGNARSKNSSYVFKNQLCLNVDKADIPKISIVTIAGKKIASIESGAAMVDLSKLGMKPGYYVISVKTKSGLQNISYVMTGKK